MCIYRVSFVISCLAGTLYAQDNASCSTIHHGEQVESFVQRASCARQAVKSGNPTQAYTLAAPIYRDAQNPTSNSRSESQAKLNDIIMLQLPDTGRQLIAQYGTLDVYTALTQAFNRDPMMGDAIRTKRTLPTPLVVSVTNTVRTTRPQERSSKNMSPSLPEKNTVTLSAQEQEIVVQVERQEIKAFTINNILDNIFFVSLSHNDSEVCQNLISAIARGDTNDIKAIIDIINLYNQEQGDAEATYTLLKEKMSSYKIARWLGLSPKTKKSEELLDLWIQKGTPSLNLLSALQKNGMPTEEQEREAGLYQLRERPGTPELQRSKVIDLMRRADSLLFQPGEARGIKTPTPLIAFSQVSAIYNTLRTTLINNKFIISNNTRFSMNGTKFTLNEIDTQLAEIIADELIRVIMENQELARQKIS